MTTQANLLLNKGCYYCKNLHIIYGKRMLNEGYKCLADNQAVEKKEYAFTRDGKEIKNCINFK